MMPTTSVIASGMNTTSSNVPREKPSGSAESLSRPPSPRPGNRPTTEASSAQNVVSTPQIQTPAMPPGTRYGRCTCGCEYRSLMSVGKITMYDRVVKSSTQFRTAAKYFSLSPPENPNAANITIVDTTPLRKFTTIGVPKRVEK